jgi:hypothetical protein
MRWIGKLTGAIVLGLLAAGCGGGGASTPSNTDPATTAASHPSAFAQGYLKFEQASNLLGTEITPLENKVTASSGNAVRMSQAVIALGQGEKGLAAKWHPALVAFEALKPPPNLARLFAATSADATKTYASLRAISATARTSSGTLTARQFITGSKDLQAFATYARALAADLEKFDKRLNVT